jgi:hypothetical protein
MEDRGQLGLLGRYELVLLPARLSRRSGRPFQAAGHAAAIWPALTAWGSAIIGAESNYQTLWRLSSGRGGSCRPVPPRDRGGVNGRAGGTPRGGHNRIGGADLWRRFAAGLALMCTRAVCWQ